MPQMTAHIAQENENFLAAAQSFNKFSEYKPATDYTRVKMREEGILRRLMELETITAQDLDKQLDDSLFVKIYEMEPDSPGALSTALATFGPAVWLRGRRYPLQLQKFQTVRFQCDVDMLRTWDMDLRQIVSDNSIKDTLAFEDNKLIDLMERALVGADQPTAWSGIPQWVTLSGGIDRDTVVEARKVMARTDASVEAKVAVCNTITYRDFEKWDRVERGGDEAQDSIKNGFHESHFASLDWVVTIKKDIVPEDRWYMFGDPSFMGHFVSMQDMTMFVKTEATMLEFFSYEMIGLSWAHTAALAIVDFASAA